MKIRVMQPWRSLVRVLTLAGVGGLVSCSSGAKAGGDRSELSSVASIDTLRVGYSGWRPFTIRPDKATARPTGFAVDLVEEISRRSSPKIHIKWVYFDYQTLKSDLDAGQLDMVAEPVFVTTARAQSMLFSNPWAYFGIGAALVRKGEVRFREFQDLDRPGVHIKVIAGWTSTDFAARVLTRARLDTIQASGGDATAQMEEVRTGQADVALNDVPTVMQYAASHPNEVKALWTSTPPSFVAGGFVVASRRRDLLPLLNSAISELAADGTIRLFDRRWKTQGFFPYPALQPGAGLTTK